MEFVIGIIFLLAIIGMLAGGIPTNGMWNNDNTNITPPRDYDGWGDSDDSNWYY